MFMACDGCIYNKGQVDVYYCEKHGPQSPPITLCEDRKEQQTISKDEAGNIEDIFSSSRFKDNANKRSGLNC